MFVCVLVYVKFVCVCVSVCYVCVSVCHVCVCVGVCHVCVGVCHPCVVSLVVAMSRFLDLNAILLNTLCAAKTGQGGTVLSAHSWFCHPHRFTVANVVQ